MRHGLVVGKFYPPHRGHQYVIETALNHAERVTVIVCQQPHERPAGSLRAAWLAELHPKAEILLIDDVYDATDSKLWADLCRGWLGRAPDVVFTSEDYGDVFASYLGCEHVCVDRSRSRLPISGTSIRNNPLAGWEYLSGPVRGYYAIRICLVGAESTGKTTLAQELADHFETMWVPEFGRDFSEGKLRKDGAYLWQPEEFVTIAKTQCAWEDRAACFANRLLICDTDAFATSIWYRRYFGRRSSEVEAIAATQRPADLYLLTDINTPFEQDGTRDGEAIRTWMHDTFVDELTLQGRKFVLLVGSKAERKQQAIEAIEQRLRRVT